tara:strand:+ start:301 stop:693 length:393 start_codon:yes stop_codon:yes gene_type:complete
MELNAIEIISLLVIAITIIKLSFMLFKKNSFNTFIEFYKSSISKNPWLYFSFYMIIAISILYFIRVNTNISYTEIVAISMFLAFLINAGLMGTNIIQHYDLSKINWKMIMFYISIWLFLMFKSLQEIFNF